MSDSNIHTERKIYLAILFIIFILVVGTIVFHRLEGWSVIDSFYFTTMTVTTIGFGDFVPTYTFSKIITSLFALMGVGTFLFLMGVVSEHYFHRRLLDVSSYKQMFGIKKKKFTDNLVTKHEEFTRKHNDFKKNNYKFKKRNNNYKKKKFDRNHPFSR